MKKITALFLTLALSLGLLAGCSGATSSSAAPGADASTAGASSAAAGEPVTLTFQYIGGTVPAQDAVINNAIAAFTEANPNIKVEPIYRCV